MPTITVKNIPPDLYETLKDVAKANRRSINSEIIVCIERALRSQPVDAEEVLRRARHLRDLTRNHPITDVELAKAKAAGRL